MEELYEIDFKMKDVSELRLYFTDLDDFLTDHRNEILFTRIAPSKFTLLEYLKDVDISVINERLHIDRSTFIYTPGTKVVPYVGVRHTYERDDPEKPPHLRSYWPKEYGQKYPVIQEVRVIGGSELRAIYDNFRSLRIAEDQKMFSEFEKQVEEGDNQTLKFLLDCLPSNIRRNPSLNSLLDFLQSNKGKIESKMILRNNVTSNFSGLTTSLGGTTAPSEKLSVPPDNHDIIILKQEKPVSQRYFISGPTQIGRAHNLDWAVEDRKIPPQFQRLEAVINIHETEYASRNHAGIYRGDDEKFYLVDLNSLNHTLVNGEDISSESGNPIPRALALNDVISITNDLELKVVGFKNSNQNNYCFMVGGENLIGVRKNLDELEAQLVKRGFEGNVIKLYPQDATKKRILERLEEVAYLTTRDSHFIFYYFGHGDEKGLALDSFNVISPTELYSKLDNIRGKKAIILDCCHAGVFLNRKNKKKVPPDSLILTASSESGKAYAGRFSAALVEYLDQNKGRLDLRDFKQKLDEVFRNKGVSNFKQRWDDFFGNNPVSIYYQEPRITGGRFTVMTAHTVIKCQ